MPLKMLWVIMPCRTMVDKHMVVDLMLLKMLLVVCKVDLMVVSKVDTLVECKVASVVCMVDILVVCKVVSEEDMEITDIEEY